MLDKFLDLIFPPVCGFCGKICKDWVCDECVHKLNVDLKIENYKDKYFDKHIYIMDYKKAVRTSILRYKFDRQIIYV